MDRIFEPCHYITVPDGTEVCAFLNATDTSQPDVPWGVLGEKSIAAGRIGPGVKSWIHVHLAVAQVTYLVSGLLTVRMKQHDGSEPYALDLTPGQAVIVEPGTLFQLENTQPRESADVLYMVSPSYVLESKNGKIVHDDAQLVGKIWDEPAVTNYPFPISKETSYEAVAARAEALRRVATLRGQNPPPLNEENLAPLKEHYDYLAPDGSEIRLLVEGENGGFAHCVLPAGKTSEAVRHRTVEELWYVLEGDGELWRAKDGEPPRTDKISVGDSLRIPVGTSFQFRTTSESDLKLLLATMPRWPCPEEAVSVERRGLV